MVSSVTSPPSFTLTRQVGSFGQQMGEYVLAQILARERNLFSVDREMRQHQWWVLQQCHLVLSNSISLPSRRWHNQVCRTLPTLSIGILGVGQIGRRGEGERLWNSHETH